MSKILCFMLSSPKIVIHYIDVKSFASTFLCEIPYLAANVLSKISTILTNDLKAVILCFQSGNLNVKSKIAKQLDEFYCRHFPVIICSTNSIFVTSTILACLDEHGKKIIKKSMDFLYCEEQKILHFNVSKDNEDHYRILSNINVEDVNYLRIKRYSRLFVCYSHEKISPDKMDLIRTKIKTALNSKNFIEITTISDHYFNKAITFKALSVFDKKYSKYEMPNIGFHDYGIAKSRFFQTWMSNPETDILKKCLVKANTYDSVPFKKTIVSYGKVKNVSLYRLNIQDQQKIGAEFNVEVETAITLSIDKYFLPHIKVKRNSRLVENGVIISLTRRTFSVIIIQNGVNKKLSHLKNIPLMISFVEGECQIGKDAEKLKKQYSSYVCSDLLAFSVNNKLQYKVDSKVLKDEYDQPFIKFNTFRGRREASPAFLLSFIIKWSILKAEQNLGIIPENIVISSQCLHDLLEARLRIACQKLKLKNFQIQKKNLIEIS